MDNSRSLILSKPGRVVLACDVSKADIHIYALLGDRRWRSVLVNSSPGLEEGLRAFRSLVEAELGPRVIVVVMESTGSFSDNLVRVAKSLGLETAWVKAEGVSRMRVAVHGDQGRTDLRDPEVIHIMASHIARQEVRDLPLVHRRLREWHRVYEASEDRIVELKGAAHGTLRRLFPDLDFGVDFLFGPSGQAIANTYGFNPHRILADGAATFRRRVKSAVPRIQNRSLERLLATAALSAQHGGDEVADILEFRVRGIFEDLAREEERLREVASRMEQLYDEARQEDGCLPEAQPLVITKLQLARLVAETGPLSDFGSWRSLLRYGGYNLVEKQSGQYRGKTRIAKKGRRLLRKVLNQAALPLVRKDRLYGPYYHRKRSEGMPGAKAMTVVGRKVLKMLWGWYRSASAFNPSRVFTPASVLPKAA